MTSQSYVTHKLHCCWRQAAPSLACIEAIQAATSIGLQGLPTQPLVSLTAFSLAPSPPNPLLVCDIPYSAHLQECLSGGPPKSHIPDTEEGSHERRGGMGVHVEVLVQAVKGMNPHL